MSVHGTGFQNFFSADFVSKIRIGTDSMHFRGDPCFESFEVGSFLEITLASLDLMERRNCLFSV